MPSRAETGLHFAGDWFAYPIPGGRICTFPLPKNVRSEIKIENATRLVGDALLVKELDQLGKIRKRAGEPVHLVDDDHVDLLCPDLLQDMLERRTLKRGAREASADTWQWPGERLPVAGTFSLPALLWGFAALRTSCRSPRSGGHSRTCR